MKSLNKILLNITILFLLTSLTIVHICCKKLVEVEGPPTSTNSDLVFSTDADATASVSNLYIKMSQSGLFDKTNLMSLSLIAGLSADELELLPGVTDLGYIAHYENSLSNTIAGIADYWSNTYNIIFVTNAVIEGINSSNTLTPAVKQQLIGEAKFMRAFSYFYLVNIYGDVPLNLTTDYKSNSTRPRTDKNLVYQQIIADLKEAQNLLGEEYKTATLEPTQERIKPNKYVAAALLARTYLYFGDNINAEIEASKVIEKKITYSLVRAESVFLKNSMETIWAIQLPFNTAKASEAQFFLPGPFTGLSNVYLSSNVTQKLSPLDNRKINWIDSVNSGGIIYRYCKKYKNNIENSETTEYPVIFRLAEQYLIRAEARAKQGKIVGSNSAEEDLNVIRLRAGLANSTAIGNQTDMLNAVSDERQRELFLEWGHRWFDLKRLGKADAILGPLKGSNWQTSDQFYLIPQTEIDGNPAIRDHQNPQ